MSGKTFATGDAKGNLWLRYGTSASTLLKLKLPEETTTNEAVTLAPRMDAVMALVHVMPPPCGAERSASRNVMDDAFRKGLGLGIPGADLHLAINRRHGRLRAETFSRASHLRNRKSHILFTFICHSHRAFGRYIHIRVSSAQGQEQGEARDGSNGVNTFGSARFCGGACAGSYSGVLDCRSVIGFRCSSAQLHRIRVPVADAAPTSCGPIPRHAQIYVYVCNNGGVLDTSYKAGPLFEKVFFNGNFISWVNGSAGQPAPFLFLMNLPGMAVLVSWVMARLYGYQFHCYIRTVRMPYSALLDLVRWLGIVSLTVILSYVLALIMQFAGFDPRNSFVGTYVQRNTLIVGFAMGFAVIPIIYTLAEDALNAVPDHLRSASLGCGATPWQTAKWVVLPTAISGVFSAIMIGMGRAVGETMIVVMSAGNTPVIDWNILNGLRALSANIAVELPEAPKDATLYRVLFLTVCVLFGMTFVINTVAELVRIHFRKRATQL